MPGYLFDTHVHTKETSPCGRIPAAGLVQLYKAAGYSGIIITDHFSLYGLPGYYKKHWQRAIAHYKTGYKLAREKGEETGLTVLWGMELSFDGTDHNDYLIYGLDEQFLLEHNNLLELDLPALRQLTGSKNILICQAHPFRPGMKPAPLQFLDGLEVYNGNPRHNSSNQFALEFAKEHSLLQISGSDAHQLEDVGKGGVYLPEPVATIEEFILLFKKQTGISLRKQL